MKKLLVNKEDAILVGIDFQEKIMPAMRNCEELENAVIRLIEGCKVMGVPMLLTQQYTKGLGMTTENIREAIGGEEFDWIEKKSFSAVGESVFLDRLRTEGRNTVLMTGIESHVCVLQTALELVEKGFDVYMVVDCVSSRSKQDKKIAMRRAEQAGVTLITMESVLFELLRGADRAEFKDISKIVK